MKHNAGKNIWLARFASIVSTTSLSIAMLHYGNVSVAQGPTASKRPTDPAFSTVDIEFFENKVRPLLVAHCLKCHGDNAEKLRGGLHLTSRAELLKGGDSGPAIVPGQPDKSLLIASVRYEDFEMPPSGKLKDAEIEILVEWIEKGAPDPRLTDQAKIANTIDIEKGRQFWAFRPRKNIEPPSTENSTWPDTSVDQYILHRLETAGITPVDDASRETLIRRAYIALAGLPPTVKQIGDFVDDPDDMVVAFAKVVDQLLHSPEFGERWGRHWLDVVRFAESSGGGRSLMFPDAWRFRDYVIDSFNADKPFDQFIKEQIAGDLLPFESHDQKLERIVATGMLALGPTNYEQQDKQLLRMEVVDEQVDTIGRAFMGLTLGCARCHDHKFDPIPMSDYYAMAGIFGSTKSLVDGNVSKYVQRPLATEAEMKTESKYREKVKRLSKQLATAKKKLEQADKNNSLPAKTEEKPGQKSRPADDLPGIVIDDRDAELTGIWIESVHTPFFVDTNYLHDDDKFKGETLAVFSPKLKSGGRYEVRLAYSPGGNRASNVPVIIDHQDGQASVIVNQSQEPPIDALFISLGVYRFEADNRSSVTISTAGTDGHVIVDAVQFLLQNDLEKQESAKKTDAQQPDQDASSDEPASEKPVAIAKANEASNEVQELQSLVKSLDKRLKQLKKKAPRTLDLAMSVEEADHPTDGHLHIRGSVRNLGSAIERGFVSVCCDGNPKPELSETESGRLQLAEWIASAEHPLTARVYVNRVWRHLFGYGLVTTTDNFGLMGQRPSHADLLDYLANELVANGWSTKKLIRKIMLSHVYHLSANQQPVGKANDPENRLLWRANRRRVDAEVLRDSILFVSGDLDRTRGGLTIRKITEYDLSYEFDSVRRSVYVPTFRNSMLDLFEVFDFANPNLVIGHRNSSTLPTQSLFLMNNPMVIVQSQNAATRILAVEGLNEQERVELAYRQALGRRPSETERLAATDYLASFVVNSNTDDPTLAAWSSFCHAIFSSLDFRYIE